MADITKSEAYSLNNGRQLLVETERGETEVVQMEALLERAVEEFGAEKFSGAEFQALLNEFTDGHVTMAGCKGVLRPLLDPGILGGAQVGAGADWNYRLATSVRRRHEDDSK